MLTVHRDDVDVFIPKTVLQFRDVKKSSWSQMIASRLETCRRLSPFECQVQFLGKIQCWNWPKRTGGRNVWNFARGL